MKRFILLLTSVFYFASINSQLIVESNGNIGAKYSGNTTIQSPFAINSAGSSLICNYINSDQNTMDIGAFVLKTGSADTGHDYSMGISTYVTTPLTSMKKVYGIYSRVSKSEDTYSGRSYGIYACVGNATPGYNYGVFGTLYGNNDGTGIYGSSLSSDGGIDTDGRFAGFFHGDVKSTDVIYATSFNTISDYRLKENIESVSSERAEDLMKLNVIKYNLKPRTADLGDSAVTQMEYYTNDSGILQRTHYGLIAQELQDIYPDLVYEGGDGFLSVNYMELIPLLIQSIQSLKDEVDQLKNNQKISKRTTIVSSNQMEKVSSINRISVSYETVTISCNIASSVKNANIFVYDANGNQIYSSDIKDRGHIDKDIKGFSLNDGIYVCSLLTDSDMDSRRFYYGK